MNNFKMLDNLPIYDLYKEFTKLLYDKKIHWYHSDLGNYEIEDQICINAPKKDPNNFLAGRGSLIYDWDKSYIKDGKIIVPTRENQYLEEDFVLLCNAFKGSLFEEVYYAITSQYKVGRIRIMKSKPKTCLTWHTDNTPRIHYSMKTQAGCFMVIDNEVNHLKQNTWWWTNTILPHTAFNGSKEERLHLVAVILEEK